MNNSRQELHEVLCQLRESFELLELPVEACRASALATSLATERPVKIVVVGEFNSGKSTLVNALCGVSLLPASILPTTATINIVQHGQTPVIQVVHIDGTVIDLSFGPDALQQFTARTGDHREIREVRIKIPYIPADLVLIDTPGVNDINQTRSEIVYEMIPEADAVIFLMDIQQLLKRSEVEFLRDRILGTSVVKTVFVLNHIDRVVDPNEIDRAVDSVRENLGSIYKDLADSLARSGSEHFSSELRQYAANIPVFTVSAKKMLRSSMAGEDLEGDPQGLRSEIFGLAAPEAKMQTVLSGLVGQTLGLAARLRREVDEQCALQGSERTRIESEIRQHTEVLRGAIEATKGALAKIGSQQSVLRTDAERAVEGVFRDASVVVGARLESDGIERGLQSIQQEIGRKLESRMEALNERIQRLAVECTRQASAFIPLPASKPHIDFDSSEPSAQPRDRIAELLKDPVNQLGFMALAPVFAFVFGWVGFAVVAFPFVARLFGSGRSDVTLDQVQDRIVKAGEEVRTRVAAAVDERLDAIAVAVLDIVDEPQQRVRTCCAFLSGDQGVRRATLESLRGRAIQMDSQLASVTAFVGTHTANGTLVDRLSTCGKDWGKRFGTAVAINAR